MIKSLRKRHFQRWLLLAIALPAGIVSAWLVIPKPLHQDLLQPGNSLALPVLCKGVDRGRYLINLRCNTDSTAFQLEWINKSPLTTPSALIYLAGENDKVMERGDTAMGQGDLIGRIGGRGIYHFSLKGKMANSPIKLAVYDILHHRIIEQIKF